MPVQRDTPAYFGVAKVPQQRRPLLEELAGQKVGGGYAGSNMPKMQPTDLESALKILGVEQAGPPAPAPKNWLDMYQQNMGKVPPEVQAAMFDQFAPGAVDPKTGKLVDPPKSHGHQMSPQPAMAGERGSVPLPTGGGAGDVRGGKRSGGGGGKPPMGGSGTVENPTENIEDDPTLKLLQSTIDKFKGDKKLDLSPILALTDSWTGSSLQRGYTRPLSDDERDQVLMNLEEKKIRHEADLKYKKAYLVQMAADRKARLDERADDRASNERIAGMRLGLMSRKDAAAESRRLMKDNKAALELIARKRYGDPSKPYSKDYKAYASQIHEEAQSFGEMLEAQDPSLDGLGYQTAIQFLLKNPSGPDGGGGQEQ